MPSVKVKLSLLKETTEDHLFGLRILQKKEGYRLSIDSLLLSSFVLSTVRSGDSLIDLGTGSGIIPLILVRRVRGLRMVGVEIQRDLVRLARENLKINGLRKEIAIIEADFRKLKKRFKRGEFEIVLSNPPYQAASSGRVSPKREKAVATHELQGTMEELVSISEYLVSPTGSVCFIYPARRLIELLLLLRNNGLTPQRLRFVYPKKDGPGELFLIEARKRGKTSLQVEKPLFLEDI